MKKELVVFPFLARLKPAAAAWAEPSVLVSQELTGYTAGTDSVTLDYRPNTKNAKTSTLSNLILPPDALPMMSQDKISLDMAALAPRKEARVPFMHAPPMFLEESTLTEPEIRDTEVILAKTDFLHI